MELCRHCSHCTWYHKGERRYYLHRQFENDINYDTEEKKEKKAEHRLGRRLDYYKALKEVKKSPDIRINKVEEIKTKIEEGNYKMNSQNTADKMLEKF